MRTRSELPLLPIQQDGSSAGPLRRRWAELPPLQRVAALGLFAWSMAMPCGLALLLGAEPSPMATTPLSQREARAAAGRDLSDAILQKPLFRRSRRPPAPPVQPAPPPPMGPTRDRQLALKGVLIGDHAAKAFVTSSASPDGTWVGVGDQIGGWQVAGIGPREVRFDGDGESLAATMDPAGAP